MPFVGAAVRRFEDPRLLRGRASFIEDLDLPRQLQVAFVLSEYPHARLVSVDLEPAYRVAGVVGAFGGLELGPRRIHATVTHGGRASVRPADIGGWPRPLRRRAHRGGRRSPRSGARARPG